jgi:hypothetical protein
MNEVDPYDAVTEDAIRHGVSIPPKCLPDVQRRAYLGGLFAAKGGSNAVANPYRDLACSEAWLLGFQRQKRDERS